MRKHSKSGSITLIVGVHAVLFIKGEHILKKTFGKLFVFDKSEQPIICS